jgi:hypothetical protein
MASAPKQQPSTSNPVHSTGMSYANDIARIGRVKLVEFPGVLDAATVRAAIQGSERIAKRISEIDAEIGFTYPPIEILPRCLVTSWEDFVFGRTAFRTFEKQAYMVVQLSTPTILAFSDQQLDAVLAHEFLHYVWSTIDFMLAAGPTIDGIAISKTVDKHVNYLKSEGSYEALDLQQQAKDSHWLTARFLDLHRKISGAGKHQLITNSALDVFRDWVQRGYPTERVDPEYRYQGPLTLDDRLIARARQLGLLASQ